MLEPDLTKLTLAFKEVCFVLSAQQFCFISQLEEAMSKTFTDRRIQVVSKKLGICKLKKLYPALFNEQEVRISACACTCVHITCVSRHRNKVLTNYCSIVYDGYCICPRLTFPWAVLFVSSSHMPGDKNQQLWHQWLMERMD